jgi:hypothetical protein
VLHRAGLWHQLASRKEDPIGAQVLLCWLALLLIRVAEDW